MFYRIKQILLFLTSCPVNQVSSNADWAAIDELFLIKIV